MDAGQPRGCHLMINGRNTEQQSSQGLWEGDLIHDG